MDTKIGSELQQNLRGVDGLDFGSAALVKGKLRKVGILGRDAECPCNNVNNFISPIGLNVIRARHAQRIPNSRISHLVLVDPDKAKNSASQKARSGMSGKIVVM